MVVRDISQRKKTELEIQSYLLRLENVMQDTLQVLAKAVDMKDPYTAGHQNRVGLLAKEIALTMGMSANEAENLRLIGLIHDIGKIGIPAELLTKPTRITALEYELIKTHVQIGYDILKNVNFMIPVADAVLQHHERLDGSGYPNHLKGSQILLEARIIAVADVVEAMSSHRPYREALGLEAALADIESGKGTKYDPVVADACLKLFRENGYRIPNV
ncbi:HD-GYP domain-containing protein [Candidatus Methylopumilus turicensis]|uniref:Sensory box protein n=1 Tax=Candidatus Methylopumilus turicensis TaxID=1581680 RepID=A0A0B7IV64_9PROT